MIGPDEIDSHQFTVRMRGFDQEEVDGFLDRVSAAHRELLARLAKSEARAERLAVTTQAIPAVGEAVGVLQMAQQTHDQTIAQANDTAGRIISAAERQATEIVESGRDKGHALLGQLEERRHALEGNIRSLEETQQALKERLKVLLDVLERP
jgi:cell division initiation protein